MAKFLGKDGKESEKHPNSVKKSSFLRRISVVILLAILAVCVICVLSYYNIVNIPIANSVLISLGIKKNGVLTDQDVPADKNTSQSYEVLPPDADTYFEDHAQVISEVDARDSDAVHTESETYDNLLGRGFAEYPITTEYSMEGEYCETIEIAESSSSKHPFYQTYYITSNGDVWTIFEINGSVMANPVSYNLQSDLDVQVIISETNVVTSYDSTTNKFYETIPNESALVVKTISRIDAETIENLTFGAIDGL